MRIDSLEAGRRGAARSRTKKTARSAGKPKAKASRSTRARALKQSGAKPSRPTRRSTSRTSSARAGRSTARSAKRTTNLDEIRRWAEARGGKPVSVVGTAARGKAGLLRIDFPGYSGAGRLQEISWDEWFAKFNDSKLEFLYQDEKESRFFKLVRRRSRTTSR